MRNIVVDLVSRLDSDDKAPRDIISWGSPVPAFGSLDKSEIATVGLNPSNREFLDSTGNELEGSERRFHTLSSLGISSWAELQEEHVHQLIEACEQYFNRNPYDAWFRALEYILSETKASFYGGKSRACHLDIVPYATERKWGALTSLQKNQLLTMAGDAFGMLLKESPIKLLVLNGISVIDGLETISDIEFEINEVSEWSLPRAKTNDIRGYSYCGELSKICEVELNRSVSVVGYNHNIQSSFGVTNGVKSSIKKWVGSKAREVGL